MQSDADRNGLDQVLEQLGCLFNVLSMMFPLLAVSRQVGEGALPRLLMESSSTHTHTLSLSQTHTHKHTHEEVNNVKVRTYVCNKRETEEL